MKFGAGKLVRRVRGMGGAFIDLVSAELSTLVSDLGDSGTRLARALVLFALAFAFAFWTMGVLIYFLIELLALALPRWGAVGIVFAVFLLVAVGLAVLAVSRFKRIESPARTVDRRLQSHLAWWRERVAGSQGGGEAAVAGVLDEDEEMP